MKKLNILIPVIILGVLLTSCLEYGLEELPAYSDAEITALKFEHRFWNEEDQKMNIKSIRSNCTIDSANAVIDCVITLSGDATLESLAAYADISVASTIAPIGSTPVLGVLGDFSQDNLQYKVTAADGKNERIWSLLIETN